MSIIIEGINKAEFCELLLGKGFMNITDVNHFFGHKIKELPPHGRLIDGDTLEEFCEQEASNTWSQRAGTLWSYAFEEFKDIVYNRETIIEAEGGE